MTDDRWIDQSTSLRVTVLDKAVRVPAFTEMVIPAKVEGDRANFRWGTTGPPSLVRRNGDMLGELLSTSRKIIFP